MAAGLACVVADNAIAQQQALPPTFEAQMRAANATTLMLGNTQVRLWAVEGVRTMGPAFDLRSRTALDNAIGKGNKVTCEVKSRQGDAIIYAQCINKQDQDLGLFMLQQGLVTADRAAVYGTVFEDAYIQAETQAQDRGLGIWAEHHAGPQEGTAGDGMVLISFGFVLFLCIIVAFTVLSIIIMRGFQKVIAAQNQNVDMMTKERKLRDRERSVVAGMLDSELKANKAKIEAYCVVYEEVLQSLKDPDKVPRYRKTGDIIQKQPALHREVFDRNTDKLDILGGKLSSELIHFYARIKTSPDYANLDPDTDLETALDIVETALRGAKRLDELAARLIKSFSESGFAADAQET
ncbi:MAG: hypothetical protein IT558_00305 [Alphaproteobacteria bacterium]|nr:hypothetical protein [Alphaproteobacteria bacterium]